MSSEFTFLKPFSYPKPIKTAIVGILVVFIYACHLTSSSIPYIRYNKQGQALQNKKEYRQAISCFEKVLEKFPSSKYAKVSLALCHFSLNTWEDDKKALGYLDGITLTKHSWASLKEVMPEEYQAYFEKQ